MKGKDSKESVENYLETILILKHKLGQVRSVDIVRAMDFKKPSVSVAMKKLRESALIEMDAEGFITLTKEGLARAESVYERHTVLQRLLMGLGVPEEIAVEDACRIEHVIHAETFARLKEHVSKQY